MKQRSEGITIIALYHFVSGFLSLLTLCGILTIMLIIGLSAPTSGDESARWPILAAGISAVLLSAIFVLIALVNWVVGWGLWRRHTWARYGAIWLSLLRLINIPVGTIIGGLIIWYLLRAETKAEFAAA
jgi:hypothetical protein